MVNPIQPIKLMITLTLSVLALAASFIGGVLVGKRNAAKLAAAKALAIGAIDSAKVIGAAAKADAKFVVDAAKKL